MRIWWAHTLYTYVFRLRRVRFPRAIHKRDDHQDVRLRPSHLLRVHVQPLRLHCNICLRLRGLLEGKRRLNLFQKSKSLIRSSSLKNLVDRAGSFGLSVLRALRILRIFKVTKWVSLIFLGLKCLDKMLRTLQVLVLVEEPCDIITELNALHHFIAVPPLSLHTHIRAARNAAIWRSFQLSRRQAVR